MNAFASVSEPRPAGFRHDHVPRPEGRAAEVEKPGEAAAVRRHPHAGSDDVRLARALEPDRRPGHEPGAVDHRGDTARVAAPVRAHEDGVEVVVLDRADAAPVGDLGSGGVSQVDLEVLVRLGVVSPLTGITAFSLTSPGPKRKLRAVEV